MKDAKLMTPISAISEPRFVASPLSSDLLLEAAAAPPARALAARFASLMLPEDSMVVDDRSHLTPAQMVENKLINRLQASSLPVSHLQIRGMVRNRFEA
ncbi:hypothetical protein TA3x_001440 [Tundrisphaera sp. TA3]|uniref:hypothetical protein n=1 Tax=Tundrisphaera sp. TA3 TaxID=3435775 RepID=UPI003EB9B4D1